MLFSNASENAKNDVEGAHVLGYASLAIGLLELAAPRLVQKLLGIEDNTQQRGILRVLGIRELGHGVSILAESKPTTGLATSVWARVAGDALDNVLLCKAAMKTKKPMQFAMIFAAVGAIGAADFLYAQRLSRSSRYESTPRKAVRWAGRVAQYAT